MIQRVVLGTLLALVVTGTTMAALGWRNATVSADAESTVASLIAAEHLRACGKAIRLNAQLTNAARFKAQDMGYRNRLSHAFVDGKRIWDFYAFAGIARPYGAGEILAVNNVADGDSPRRAFHQWMESPGHRALIRTCGYDRFGVGAFQAKGGGDGGSKWYAAEFTNVERP